MNKYLKHIDHQIEANQGKNILRNDNHPGLKFIDETIKAISGIMESDAESEELLIEYAKDKALSEFCRINQYYTFNRQAINDLRLIYRELFSSIRTKKDPVETISKNHYANLKQWLLNTNPFAEKIYADTEAEIEPVACAEYSPDFQMRILKIDPGNLMKPLLDIGCGKQGKLVNYLSTHGIEAYGVDRFSFPDGNLINADWLEYNYGIRKWGTIVSNLGFSNHFKHHNLREDGNYLEYAVKYMEILNSLKTGGVFHYAPDLPFIESYLDIILFQVEKYEIGEFDFKTSLIRRLK